MHDATQTAGLAEGPAVSVSTPAAGSYASMVSLGPQMSSAGMAQLDNYARAVSVTRIPPRTRRIAILGFGATVKDVPWQDETLELWGLNGFWRVAKSEHGINVPEERYTLWFDMHSLGYVREYGKRAGIEGEQEAWLQQPHPFPIFSVESRPEHPSVVPYPIEQLVETFNRDYFTSGVAYAIAYALSLPDVAEVALYGIDLIHDTEYEQQRPCAEYWIGRAEERGIKITVHEQSALLKQRYRYGYNQENPLGRELRAGIMQQVSDLRAAIAKNRAEGERLFAQANTDDGACQALVSVLNRLEHWDRGGRVA